MKTLPILTDRSRYETMQTCPRKRYYSYEYQDKGLQSTKLSLPLVVGSAFHLGAEVLLTQEAKTDAEYTAYLLDWLHECKEESSADSILNAVRILKDLPVVEAAIQIAQIYFDEQVQSRGLSVVPSEASYAYQENRALIEVLIRVWAKVGLPELLREYEVLEVEKEIDVPLYEKVMYNCPKCGNNPMHSVVANECDVCDSRVTAEVQNSLILMTRPDAILRHRSTSNIVVLSFKTASSYSSANEKRNKWDNQSIGEMIGVEYWLESIHHKPLIKMSNDEYKVVEGIRIGEPCKKVSATRMEYVIKGLYSKAEKDHPEMNIYTGQRYYSSNPILHPFSDMTAIGEGRYEPLWNYKKPDGSNGVLGKNWKKINAWEQGESFIKDWIEHLWNQDDGFGDGRKILQNMVVNPVEFNRNEFEIERFKRQVIKQEMRIADATWQIKEINTPEINPNHFATIDLYNKRVKERVERTQDFMDEHFSLNSQSCVTYNSICTFANACWNHTPVETLIEFGELMWREKNHSLEKEGE